MASNGKMMLIVMDGLGDRPCRELGGKTPLQAAFRPNMNSLIREGSGGLMNSVRAGMTTGSDTSHLSLLGYDPEKFYTGRGPFEAMGLGMKLRGGDLAFRANFATIDSNRLVTDRRAGRIDEDTSELAEALTFELDGVQFSVKNGVEHRAALIMRGDGLSDHISDTDPHSVGLKVKDAMATQKDGLYTAEVLNRYMEKAEKILANHPFNQKRRSVGKPPANSLLVRGAGMTPVLTSFRERHGFQGSCVAGISMIKGICALLGMNVLEVEGAIGTVNSNYMNKIDAAIKELEKVPFVLVNFKGTDAAGHDGLPVLKRDVIEKMDRSLSPLIGSGITVCITGDHSTPCELKEHSGDPLPILFNSPGSRNDRSLFFDETSCADGSIRIDSGSVLQFMKQLSGHDEKYGA